MRKFLKLEVRRVKPMSQDGYDRLSKRAKTFYKQEVYKPIFRGNVNVDNIDCEESLAQWLFMNFGNGTFVLHSWRKEQKKPHLKHYTKALCKVEITALGESSFNYDYEHTRYISKYGFWIGEY